MNRLCWVKSVWTVAAIALILGAAGAAFPAPRERGGGAPKNPRPAAAPESEGPSTNLLRNGDFETADAKGVPENWVLRNMMSGTQAKATLDAKAFSGKTCLALEGTTEPVSYGVFSQPVDVSAIPGGRLIFSCYYRAEDRPQADISITTFDTDFTQNEWKTPAMQSESRSVPFSKDWALMSWQFDCQPTAKHVVVMFRIAGRGKAFFDGAALRAYPCEVGCTVTDPGLILNIPDHRTITVQFTNNTDRQRKAHVIALATVAGEKPSRTEDGVDLDPRAKGTITLEYRLDARKPHRLQIIVLGENPIDVYENRVIEVGGVVVGRIVAPAFRGTVLNSLPEKNIVAEGYINAAPEVARAMKLEARLMGTGQTATAGDPNLKVSANGEWHLELPTTGMLAGNFTVRVTARLDAWEGSLDLPMVKAPSSDTECGYDRRDRTWLSGRPIFPIGIYYALDIKDVPPLAEAGFNFIINPSRTMNYDFADKCVASNLGFIISSPTLEDTFWKNMYQKYGKNPALMGWYIIERPDTHLTSVDVVKDMHTRLATLDPHHPVFMAIATPSDFSDYLAAADVPLIWTDIIPTAPVSVVGMNTEAAVRAVNGRTPVWVVIQITGRGYASNKDLDVATNGRPPTAAEYRAMVYEALVHGANGIVSYAYTIPSDPRRRPYSIGHDAPELWEGVKATNHELAWLGPVFANGKRTALPPAASGAVDMAEWTTPTGKYLVAVNGSKSAALTMFTVPGCEAARLDVLFENRTVGGSGNGSFADTFDPNQVHVYSWR